MVMSMDILRVTEEVTPEDIAHTMTYIEKTKKGEMKKREPFSVVERGDGTYSILDGNKCQWTGSSETWYLEDILYR